MLPEVNLNSFFAHPSQYRTFDIQAHIKKWLWNPLSGLTADLFVAVNQHLEHKTISFFSLLKNAEEPRLKFTARIKMKEWLLKLLQLFRLDFSQSQDTEIMGFNSPTTNEIMTPTKSLNLVNLILVRCIEFSVSLLEMTGKCTLTQHFHKLVCSCKYMLYNLH